MTQDLSNRSIGSVKCIIMYVHKMEVKMFNFICTPPIKQHKKSNRYQHIVHVNIKIACSIKSVITFNKNVLALHTLPHIEIHILLYFCSK